MIDLHQIENKRQYEFKSYSASVVVTSCLRCNIYSASDSHLCLLDVDVCKACASQTCSSWALRDDLCGLDGVDAWHFHMINYIVPRVLLHSLLLIYPIIRILVSLSQHQDALSAGSFCALCNRCLRCLYTYRNFSLLELRQDLPWGSLLTG